ARPSVEASSIAMLFVLSSLTAKVAPSRDCATRSGCGLTAMRRGDAPSEVADANQRPAGAGKDGGGAGGRLCRSKYPPAASRASAKKARIGLREKERAGAAGGSGAATRARRFSRQASSSVTKA